MKKLLRAPFLTCLIVGVATPGAATAGTVSVAIQNNGEAAIITRTAFRVCTNSGQDAWSLEHCAGWRPLGRGRRTLIGYYCVQGWWPNGGRYRAGLDMTLSVRHRDLLIVQQPQNQKGFC